MNSDPLIGGLSASLFINRQVKVRWGDGSPQPSICTVLGITTKGRIQVKVSGGAEKKYDVEPKCVMPFWSRNPDLKKKAEQLQSIGAIPVKPLADESDDIERGKYDEIRLTPAAKQILASRKPESPSKAPPAPVEIIAEPVPMPTPPTKPEAKPAASRADRTIKGIRAIDPSKPLGMEWIGDYEALQKVAGGISAKQAMAEKLAREVKEDRDIMELYIKELESKGVAIEWTETP